MPGYDISQNPVVRSFVPTAKFLDESPESDCRGDRGKALEAFFSRSCLLLVSISGRSDPVPKSWLLP